MDVEAGLAKDDIVAVLFAEGGGEADVEFVGFAESGRGVGVVTERVAGFDSVDERAKHSFELGDLLNVEDFAAGLVRNFTNVDEAGDHAGGEKSLRWIVAGNFQVIQDGIGCDGFGDDIVRALSSGIGTHVIADENDDAAALGRELEEILGGKKDAVIDASERRRKELICSAVLPCLS